MNTLKEYIVTLDTERDLLEIWKRELWESFQKGGRNPEKYKLITTFNADEQLQEQKGLRWVKGNYEKLYKLAKAGNRVACYVDYDFYRDGGIHPKFRDICSIGHNPMYLEFSARGIGYSTYIGPGENELEEFLIECTRLNVEWLDETQPGQPVPAGEWISVEEELPEKNLPVLIAEPPCSENEPWNINVSFWDGSYSKGGMVKHAQFPDGQDEQPGFYWPTHWRPLPAPPSPKQEDKP